MKSWIRIRNKIKIENSEALEAKHRALYADSGSLEAQKWSPGGFTDQSSQIPITVMRSRIRNRISKKSENLDPDQH